MKQTTTVTIRDFLGSADCRRNLDRMVRAKSAAAPIAQWLEPQEVLLDIELFTRRHALEFAAQSIARLRGLDPAPIFRALWRRELVGSTALGQGVAIPHARIDGIERPLTLFMRPKWALDFAAPDGKPVADILVIMVPTDGATDDHLVLLALVAQVFADRSSRSRLVRADTATDVRRVFADGARRLERQALAG